MATASDNGAPRSMTAGLGSIPPPSPANTLFAGSAPTSPLTQPDVSSADCCVVLGKNVSEGFMPCPEHTGRRRRTVFGITLPGRRSQKALDPFDYEQKYPEAEPYKEMGDGGRIWKTYVEESIKVDANQVADWTDALDVLLVFAGLFSAVVSSFVSQTYQSLLVDHSEVTSYLTYESINLQRAKDANISLSTIPRSELAPNSTSDPSLTAVCVNGLWFTSLTLSLTTALIAVLTKQWIHQYMSFSQTGGPRERTQLRQARADNLEAWNVPVIIGLLPVMMHVALGVFLAGLIIFLRSLSNPIMGVVSVMAFIALCAYVASNLLPVFKASCPYVTPLTHYAYRLVFHLRHFNFKRMCRRLRTCVGTQLEKFFPLAASHILPPALPERAIWRQVDIYESSSALYPPTLREAERQMVKSNALVLEAKAAAWLFTVSSNSSVHRVVLHALSNIPLQMVSIIRNVIGQQVLTEAVSSALASADYSQPEQRAVYERLIRSHIRLCPKEPIKVLPLAWTQTDLSPFVLTLGHPERAVQLLREEMLRDSVKLDVAAWAQIMQKAMSFGDTGFEWIDGSLESSSAWRKFLSWFLCHHRCLSCARHRGSGDEVYALVFLSPHLDHFCGSHFSLVLDSKSKQESATTEPIFFSHAVQHFMIPSLSVVLYNFVYSSLCTEEVYDAVPSDIRLRLAMLQSTFIQSTSSESNERSLFAHALRCVHESLGVKGVDAAYLHHRDVLHATFLSLKNIVDITFRSSGVLCARDRTGVLHALFRILILSPAHHEDYVLWMTDDVASRITRIIFTGDPEWHGFGRFIADALEANVQVPCTQLLSNLYSELCTRGWLKTIAHEWFGNGLYYHYVKRTHTSYRFAAAAFVAGLDVIGPGRLHDQVLEYIQQRENLVTLCKLLILADVERRKTLRTLAAHIPGHLWMSCLIDMQEFLQSEETKGFYRYQLKDPHRHPYSESQTLVYEPFHKLSATLLKLAPLSHKPSHLVRIVATVPSPEVPLRVHVYERNTQNNESASSSVRVE